MSRAQDGVPGVGWGPPQIAAWLGAVCFGLVGLGVWIRVYRIQGCVALTKTHQETEKHVRCRNHRVRRGPPRSSPLWIALCRLGVFRLSGARCDLVGTNGSRFLPPAPSVAQQAHRQSATHRGPRSTCDTNPNYHVRWKRPVPIVNNTTPFCTQRIPRCKRIQWAPNHTLAELHAETR